MPPSFKNISVTPSYERVRQRFLSFMTGDQSADVGHLMLALLCEESLGGKCLADLGITISGIADGEFGDQAADTACAVIAGNCAELPDTVPFPTQNSSELYAVDWYCRLHERAGSIARRSDLAAELSTEHLLRAMVELAGPVKERLEQIGISPALLLNDSATEQESTVRLAVDFDLNLDSPSQPADASPEAVPMDVNTASNQAKGTHASGEVPTSSTSANARIFALLDANLNRAREGLRVLEDFARFVKRAEAESRVIKKLRHDLVNAELQLSQSSRLLRHRNVEEDVGTGVTTTRESDRDSTDDIIRANARRVQEALRSLEEFGKLVDTEFAATIKQLRYRSYQIEGRLLVATDDDETSATPRPEHQTGQPATRESQDSLRQQRVAQLMKARLYVLVTDHLCRLSWQDVVRQALHGGADVIQLREKGLSDDEILSRGRWVREQCDAHDALFILNDRVDLATAANAHGVHLGQEDMAMAEARLMSPPEMLIGLSTHDAGQLRQACDAEADYLGVGPVMPSNTKSFSEFPGLEFVRFAANHADRPWFAIGGIDTHTVNVVTDAGANRVAVSSAVIGQDDPASAAAELRQLLRNGQPDAVAPASDSNSAELPS